MPDIDLQADTAELLAHLRGRGKHALEMFLAAMKSGDGGDLTIRLVPNIKDDDRSSGKRRYLTEAGFRTYAYPL